MGDANCSHRADEITKEKCMRMRGIQNCAPPTYPVKGGVEKTRTLTCPHSREGWGPRKVRQNKDCG